MLKTDYHANCHSTEHTTQHLIGIGSKLKLLSEQFIWCCFALHILRLWSELFLFFFDILQHMAKELPVLVVKVAISLVTPIWGFWVYFITNSILIVLWHWFSLLVANRNVNWLKTKEEAFKQSIANYIFLRPGDEMSLVGNEKYAETTQQLPSHVQYTSSYQSQYTLLKCKWSRQLLQSERGLPISNSLFGTLPQDNGNRNRHNNNNNNNNNDDVE